MDNEMTKKNQEILKIGQITFYTLKWSEKWSNHFFDSLTHQGADEGGGVDQKILQEMV